MPRAKKTKSKKVLPQQPTRPVCLALHIVDEEFLLWIHEEARLRKISPKQFAYDCLLMAKEGITRLTEAPFFLRKPVDPDEDVPFAF